MSTEVNKIRNICVISRTNKIVSEINTYKEPIRRWDTQTWHRPILLSSCL